MTSTNFKTFPKQDKDESTVVDISALEKTIIDKIKYQWKTIRKAFIDLNK